MHKRLKKTRKDLGLSQIEFANQLDIDRSYFSQLETGKRPIVSRWINLICKLYRVNRVWFETGEGDMFLPEPRAEPPPGLINLDETVDEFVVAASKLPPEMQKLIIKVGLALCDKLDAPPLGASVDGGSDERDSKTNLEQ